VVALLREVADSDGGRMNKLDVHQLTREVGLERAALARLYSGDPPLLQTDKQDRVITDAGRDRDRLSDLPDTPTSRRQSISTRRRTSRIPPSSVLLRRL
jgi:hypothetical protein